MTDSGAIKELREIVGTLADGTAGGRAPQLEWLLSVSRNESDPGSGGNAMPGTASESLTSSLATLRQVVSEQTVAVKENSLAVAQNTSSAGSRAGETVKTVAKTAGSMLTAAFPLAGLITGLVRMLGGGSKTEEEVPLTKYTLPSPLEFQVAMKKTGEVMPYDYDASGKVRLDDSPGRREPPAAVEKAPLQVTVQVNAMDSKSFSDHSADIARAVREAILNSHSLNDVIAEL